MPAAFIEDLTVFFADWGVPALVGEGRPAVTVIFDKAYISLLRDHASGSSPECVGRTEDLAHLEEGDPIVIDGEPYSIAGDPQPDGTGLTYLQLRG